MAGSRADAHLLGVHRGQAVLTVRPGVADPGSMPLRPLEHAAGILHTCDRHGARVVADRATAKDTPLKCRRRTRPRFAVESPWLFGCPAHAKTLGPTRRPGQRSTVVVRWKHPDRRSRGAEGGVVRKGGFEPPRPFGHWILSPARLPLRHSRSTYQSARRKPPGQVITRRFRGRAAAWRRGRWPSRCSGPLRSCRPRR